MKLPLFVLALTALCQSSSAFSNVGIMHNNRVVTTKVALNAESNVDGDTRRDFFSKTTSAAIAATTGLGQGVLAPLPAYAANVDKVNAKLRG